ncbi:MAG TPA: RagB/SusD family nutrient uptake outer membrane protein [Gemmatimonadaceae bacterium]|nr:RagB/SusD family nutrient uptake outer membrane protein [Gemmatimonadaceae bacterium]
MTRTSLTRARVFAGQGVLFGALLAAAACDPNKALEVEDVDVVSPVQLNDKSALPTLRNGVLSTFQLAYSGGADLSNGGHEGQATMSGLLADEFLNAESFPDRISVDMRDIIPSNLSLVALFLDLSRARATADFASSQYNRLDAGAAGQSEVLSIAGFSYVLFGENYCSGVPFSTLNATGGVTYGDPQTGQQVLTIAVAKFDSAITIATAANDAGLLNLARVGKARALVDLGQFAAAGAAAAAVPTSFEYLIRSSANSLRQNNGIWNYTANTFAFSVPDREGRNGLPYLSAKDPRLEVVATGQRGFDRATPFNLQLKYADLAADVQLASGTEARLVQAEAAFRAGTPAAALAILNTLRASAGLTALTDPGSDAARADLLFRERAFWMWGTAHRLGDMRRLVRQYGRVQSAVFPTGDYHKGGQYGSDVNFPVSSDERNNPKFTGCIDRSA